MGFPQVPGSLQTNGSNRYQQDLQSKSRILPAVATFLLYASAAEPSSQLKQHLMTKRIRSKGCM
eukprot:m.30595 g.30595  ORF g.30595 m.30595 type:complete len:64 (+) comp10620_c0_seq2:538-729(+)